MKEEGGEEEKKEAAHCVKEAKFQGKHHPMGKLFKHVVHELKALEVEREDVWELFDLHPLLRLLKTSTGITKELVLVTQRFTRGKVPQAASD